MRHGDIETTMNYFTDPRLLDVAGVLDKLPALPLGSVPGVGAFRATGTDGKANLPPETDSNLVAPVVAPTSDKPCSTLSFPGKTFADEPGFKRSEAIDVSGGGKRKEPLTTVVNGSVRVGAIGLEPMTPSLSSWCSSQLS
jgi:hypothetical protein